MFIAVAALVASGAAFAAGPALYKTQDCNMAVTQFDLNQCAGANADAADAALNVVYKRLLQVHPDTASVTRLKKSERAWVAYRDKACASEVGPQADGGSIWPMEMSNCLETKTAARLRELKHQLDCPEGPLACSK
jgi:uncharacterized protein YecT (DUF1311 family)